MRRGIFSENRRDTGGTSLIFTILLPVADNTSTGAAFAQDIDYSNGQFPAFRYGDLKGHEAR